MGIDLFSSSDRKYHVAQCKIPVRDWLEANPGKARLFGPSAIDDPRDALRYLVGESKSTPNDNVRYLYSLIEGDRKHEDFNLVFFLIVYGRLDSRAVDAWHELESQYKQRNITLVLEQIDNLVDGFLVGAARANSPINFDLRINSEQALHAKDYCYCLVNAADVFKAFQQLDGVSSI